ncbi:MAG TPA: hypothetical protein VKV95_20030 [Terriglobia bacterium]|nr:hypothetical protein [Terriglobia bacterium]
MHTRGLAVRALVIALVYAMFAISAFSQTPATDSKKDSASGDDVSTLKQMVIEQQKQIEQLQSTVNAMKQKLDESGGTSRSASDHSGSIGQVASMTPVIPAAAKAKDAMPVVGSTLSSGSGAVGVAAPPANEETPSAIHFKGINITPVGFMAAETVWRDHALSADVNTPAFSGIVLPGQSQYQLSEFNASGRQSRIGSLFEGKLDHAKIGGYYEADFLSAATTSNDNQSNSYALRQRQFWGQFALDNGWTFTGGQMWSLVTETKKGADNRSEALPMTIDAQYTAGFSWARQYGMRVVKNFNSNFALAFSLEEAQFSPITQSGGNANWLAGQFGTSGGLYNPIANYSYDKSPDFVAKVIAQPKWGHFELFGLVNTLRDRVFPCQTAIVQSTCTGAAGSAVGAFNNSRTAGGVGANARVTLAKHVDVGVHVFGGAGIGRYGSGGLAVATLRPDGTLAPLRNLQTLGTLEYHGKKLDVYSNFGAEFAGRAFFTNYLVKTPVPAGYGNPLFRDDGCTTEPLPGAGSGAPVTTPTGVGGSAGLDPGALSNCTAHTRDVIEATVGFWYRFYKGPKGTVQWGPQYSYVVRNIWSGVNAAGTVSYSPQGTENMFFTSLRYYLP